MSENEYSDAKGTMAEGATLLLLVFALLFVLGCGRDRAQQYVIVQQAAGPDAGASPSADAGTDAGPLTIVDAGDPNTNPTCQLVATDQTLVVGQTVTLPMPAVVVEVDGSVQFYAYWACEVSP